MGLLDFLGIGAQKAGTSWVFRHLSDHPDIRFPAGKEVHFWDSQAWRGEAWWQGLFAADLGDVRQGEITPAYSTLDLPPVRRINELYPDLRIFYCVRNPIERAWSQARMVFTRSGASLESESDTAIIAFFDSPRCHARGDYLTTLQHWSSVFAPGQMLIMVFDDLVAEPTEFLITLADHLGVDPAPFRNCDADLLKQKVWEGATIPIRSRLRDHLFCKYEQEISLLSKRLGRDLGHWLTG